MSKILKLSILIIYLFSCFTQYTKNIVFAKKNETYFIVTAYYSPLPNQRQYMTWSYYWDLRLNWNWHTTASQKPINIWYLAAPTKYPFGTKIYFNWYGVWVVEDRWWAIVKAWNRWYEYDRIDVWVGYWDEWLQRAKKWGKRTIKWRVVSRISKVNLEFGKDVLKTVENIKVNPKNHNEKDVKKLQEKFIEFSIYNWEIDGKYESIKESLINFQVENKIIKSKNDIAAWWFGPKTYLTLLKKYWNEDILIKKETKNLMETSDKVKIILNHEEIKLNWDAPQESEVKKVQSLLKKLGMYDWEIDGSFDKIKKILLDFQKKAGIIRKDDDWWAWYFWEKTKQALVNYFENNEKSKKKTIDDISYEELDEIWNKLKKYSSKEEFVEKLKKARKKVRNSNQTKKIDYLIEIIES